MVAASGSTSAELAGSIGDGLISTIANEKLVKKFRVSEMHGKSRVTGR